MRQSRAFPYVLPVVVFFTALIYCLGLHGIFVYDDIEQIVNRNALHHLTNLHDVIFCGLRQNRVWQNISFALNWSIAPGQTWGFKLFSLFLHLANGSLLYLWLKKMFADQPYLPVLATSLFLIHPLQIQSVTYIMSVDVLFQAFFYFLALYWYSKYSLTRLPGLIMILIASLLARETCVFIPVVLLVYELWIHQTSFKDLPKQKWAALFALPLLYYPLSRILHDPGASMYLGIGGLYPFWKHLATQLYFQSFYLVLFLNPRLQSLIHANPPFDLWLAAGATIGALIWVGGFGFLLRQRKHFPRASFFIFLFFLSYLPTNSFLQLINPFAEYRLYLSNLPLCILLAYGILRLSSRLTVPAVILTYFAVFTFQNVMIWKSWDLIFNQAFHRYPNYDFNANGMGVEYLAVAWREYQSGNYPRAWEIVGRIEKSTGRYPLPARFFNLKDALEQKMNALGLSTVHHWDEEHEPIQK